MSQVTATKSPDPAYGNLYSFGAVAAWIVAFLTVAEVIAFMFLPQASTASEWFMLFQDNPVAGLVGFWGLEIPMYVMFAPVFLALYVALRAASPSAMAVALALALLGVAIFLATTNPVAMLSLSNQHAAATDEARRAALLGAGEALLANTNQRAVGGFNTGLFLVSVAGLIVSAAMLSASAFSRATGYLGILAFALSLADYLRQAVTASEVIALLVILPGAVLLLIWFVVVGRRLWQLGRVGE